MKNISKLFGAAAIVGLFMLGSTLTVFAADTAPADPPQPLGIIPSDLRYVPDNPIVKTTALRIKVTVYNNGPGCAWMPWQMHIVVDKLLYKDQDTFTCYGPVFPQGVKSFESKAGLGDIILRHTEVWLDATNTVWEGLLGETNNYKSVWV